MSTVSEIETAIRALPDKDIFALSQWLENYCAELWDKQIEADAKAGRLDKFIREARAD